MDLEDRYEERRFKWFRNEMDLMDALKIVLKEDKGAMFVGDPKWDRDNDPELYDAVVATRVAILQRIKHFSSPGGTYIRELSGYLGDEYMFDLLHRLQEHQIDNKLSAGNINPLDVMDERVRKVIKQSTPEPDWHDES